MTELGLSNAPPDRRRGRLRRARRVCASALALAGCIGLLPRPRRSADLSTIRLPPGFAIEFFAKDLGNARFLTLDPRGTLLVSVPRAGRVVALPDDNGDGRADSRCRSSRGSICPTVSRSSMASSTSPRRGGSCASTTIRRTRRVRGAPTVVVPDLPARGSHWTRTIAIGPDRRLYVSVGSSCNSCEERDHAPSRDHPVRARRPIGHAVRDGAPQRGRDRLPPRHLRAVGDRQWPRLARRRPRRPSTSPGSRRAASTAGRTATGPPARARRRPRPRRGRPLQGRAAAELPLPGAHGAPRARLLHGRPVPARVPRRPLRRAPRLLESRGARGLQGHPREARRREPGRGGLRERLARRRSDPGAGRWTSRWRADGALYVSDDSLGAVYRITYRSR